MCIYMYIYIMLYLYIIYNKYIYMYIIYIYIYYCHTFPEMVKGSLRFFFPRTALRLMMAKHYFANQLISDLMTVRFLNDCPERY